MINVDDLNLKKEILPLLDFTLNPFAYEKLTGLFSNLPESISAITYRQLVIKGILLNWDVLKEYSYNKGDFIEVYYFLNRVSNGFEAIPQQRLNHILQLHYNKRERLRIAGPVIQSMQLFYRLQNRYFSMLSVEHFPKKFRSCLEEIQHCCNLLNMDQYQKKITEYNLSAKDLATILHLIKKNLTPDVLGSFWDSLFLFEAYLSLAKSIQKYNFIFPQFHDKNQLSIQQCYHPALKSPIKNDLNTCDGNVILLTGPNMSGKSTLLKAVALCIYLAHTGMAVPANSCSIPFFNSISVSINQRDDILNGYSHFMTEILSLKSVVTESGKPQSKCFAIFDELFKGTNIEDALSISATTILGLTKFTDSFFFISTHIHALEHLSNLPSINAYYLECELKDNFPSFTYILQKGWSDLKIGQILFEQEGLNKLLS